MLGKLQTYKLQPTKFYEKGHCRHLIRLYDHYIIYMAIKHLVSYDTSGHDNQLSTLTTAALDSFKNRSILNVLRFLAVAL